MPAKRLSMRKIREVLRLKSTTQLSQRQIATAVGIARSTVAEYLSRLEVAGVTWPLPDEFDEAALDRLLFAPDEPTVATPRRERAVPEWSQVHAELRRKGVTLRLLWQEYKSVHRDGYNYSRYCDLYQQWRGSVDVVMRQTHTAGERLFVDYAGQTVEVVDATSGEVRHAQIFVAVLGASNYTYCEATWTQEIADWIGSHQRAFAFFGGVPKIVVPDNLKSGVTTAHRYDPEINRSYAEMAEHYGVAIIPARVRKPRDKAKVESGVQLVEQSILAPLRDRTFLSLGELNQSIAALLEETNNRPFQKLPGSRRTAFEQIDRPALGALPQQAYEVATWKKARVNIDYHIDVDGHYYSVPYTYARQQLDVRISQTSIECFIGTRRIAAHARSRQHGQHTTLSEHMPRSHREYAEWTPQRIIAWAEKIGQQTATLVEQIIEERAHPEQGYRACLGILRLARAYGNDRLEAAATRAICIGTRRYKSVESILRTGLDRQPLPQQSLPQQAGWRGDVSTAADAVNTTYNSSITAQHDSDAEGHAPDALQHENIRGASYYRWFDIDSSDADTSDIGTRATEEQEHGGITHAEQSDPYPT